MITNQDDLDRLLHLISQATAYFADTQSVPPASAGDREIQLDGWALDPSAHADGTDFIIR